MCSIDYMSQQTVLQKMTEWKSSMQEVEKQTSRENKKPSC